MSIGERYEGTVKSWKEPWGWVSSSSVGSDVFCHIQDLTSGHLGKDASVTFELGTDQKSGKPRALHIEVLGVTDRPESETGQRLTGSIHSWKDAWGWISCPELDAQIFGHREDLVNADPHTGLEVGSAVRFDVSTDDKSGKPRAKRIELLDVKEKLTGEILSWKDQWGWIKCHQAEGDVFAHSDDLLTIVQVGVKVTFEMGQDQKSGRRRARNIAAVGSKGKGKGKDKGKEMMMMPMQMPMHHGYGGGPPDAYGGYFGGAPDGYGKGGFGKAGKPGKGFGAPMDHYGKGMGMMSGYGPPPAMAGFGGKGGLPGPQAFIGQQLEGRVAMWKELWGWISCPHFGGDIFAHQEDLKGASPTPGSAVVFVPGTDNKGRMRALMITPLGGGHGGQKGGSSKRKGEGKAAAKDRPGEADFEQLEGSVIEGECASWKSPWGWIKSPNFAGDLFAHVEDVLSGEELVSGQNVSFTVARDHKSGRWRAREINAGAIPDGSAKRQRT